MDADRMLSALLVALVVGLALLVLAQGRELATVAGAVGRLQADLGDPTEEGGSDAAV